MASVGVVHPRESIAGVHSTIRREELLFQVVSQQCS